MNGAYILADNFPIPRVGYYIMIAARRVIP